MSGHVFISHASENQDEASELVALIESKGVTAWIAPRDVRPGLDYSEELQKAIENSVAFVVLVTDDANTSPYVRAETEMAFSCHKPMLPVRFADISAAPGLAFFLKIRNWTNAYGAKREAALARLVLELQTLTGTAPSWAPKVGPATPPADAAPLAEPVPPAPVPPSPPAAPPPLAADPATPQPAGAARPVWLWALIGVLALAAIAAAIFFLTRRTPSAPVPGPNVNGSLPAPPAPTPTPTPAPPAPQPQDRAYGGELVDFGVPAKSELESNVGSPTPFTIPVGARVTTAEVQRSLNDGTNPILVDVLAGAHAQTLPNALYMPAGGMPGSFQDEFQATFAQQLAQASGGDTGRALVFFCQGASCWESYNAALRANAAGYANIYWYRGGLVAWAEAAYPTSPLPAPYGGGAGPKGY